MINRMANSVNPDVMAGSEPSHQYFHCLQRYRYWSVGMKGLKCSLELTTILAPKYWDTYLPYLS